MWRYIAEFPVVYLSDKYSNEVCVGVKEVHNGCHPQNHPQTSLRSALSWSLHDGGQLNGQLSQTSTIATMDTYRLL